MSVCCNYLIKYQKSSFLCNIIHSKTICFQVKGDENIISIKKRRYSWTAGGRRGYLLNIQSC